MARPELVATRGFKYMTRRLVAGDIFEAKNAIEAKILTDVRKVAAVPQPKLARKAEPADDEIATLRAAYADKLGKRPFNGWDADTLREKIADSSDD